MENEWLQRWEDRFNKKEYAYGVEPNTFLAQQLQNFKTGKILFGAEGEGRNAVFADKNGWDVAAFDISTAAKNKAQKLAKSTKATIDYRIGNLPELGFKPRQFDVIALIYAHFPADIRGKYHAFLAELLKPGGHIIFEGFGENHLRFRNENPNVGGPRDQETLFSKAEIQQDFKDFKVNFLEEKPLALNEGLYHNGTGSVLRFIGEKL